MIDVDKENFVYYKVMIGLNESYLNELLNGIYLKNEEKFFMVIFCVNLMIFFSSMNLDSFLECYRCVGKFYIMNILEMLEGFSFSLSVID